jgi:membrane-anchored protein YejM (alkaline phosphatase superfamily)
VAGLLTAALALDARIQDAVGFHLNGFFFRVLLQPNALRETGVLPADVALVLVAAVVIVTLDVMLGAWFIRRFRADRPTWRVVVALVLLCTAERVYGAALSHFGGPAIFAASGTLPLQVPLRMEAIVEKVFGERARDPFAHETASKRLPTGVAPESIRLTRTPDILFIVAESLPTGHLDPVDMPNLWRRAQDGARFTTHYSTACATHYALFSLMYGLQAQKLEAIVGSGRGPLLFDALAANGYKSKILAASCVDWMDLQKTVFGGQDVETWCKGIDPPDRDATMMARAHEVIASADPSHPMFLFLFFFGTHFNYFYGPNDRVHVPDWDGSGGIKATSAPGSLIEARAQNAAHALDRELEQLLTEFEAKRGKAPLVVFTGDHGEEFRQKGHIGHGSDVTREQIAVPAVWLGPGVPKGVYENPTSHVDIVPTLLHLLGDSTPPARYADGMSMFDATPDRFVVSTVGWEPHYAVIGKDLKVRMYAGRGTVQISDPDDQPLPDGDERMARKAGRIMRALRGEADASAAPAPAGGQAAVR